MVQPSSLIIPSIRCHSQSHDEESSQEFFLDRHRIHQKVLHEYQTQEIQVRKRLHHKSHPTSELVTHYRY